MDVNWQHNNPANPADAAIGPQGYDNHLYYSFGVRIVRVTPTYSVADRDHRVWLIPPKRHTSPAFAVRIFITLLYDRHSSCDADLDRVQSDAAVGNSPLWFGEWGLPTQFQATDEFLFKWADAQKLAYSQGRGWIVSASVVLKCHPIKLTLIVLELQN